MTPMEQLKAMVAGKKVAFIGAGVSHKPCITMLAALGTFEQGVVRKRNAIFSDKKAVSSIQYLIVLVVSHYRENRTFGFVYPLRGLCHTPLSQ